MTAPTGSVVIPAHDEQDLIGATLDELLADAGPGEFQVVVVCNGCSDDTAGVARRHHGVQVEELSTPSKIAALRHGDTVATAFPRIYLDGDVRLETAGARAIIEALQSHEPRIAGVVGHVDATTSTRPAQWYFDFRQRLPVFHQGIIGAGVYAMNEPARRRIGTWPDILGDDEFVFLLFDDDERVTVPGHHTTVEAPPDLRSVLRRQVRVRRGNADLTAGRDATLETPPAGIWSAVREVLADPRGWPGLATWVAVNGAARALARVRPASGDWTWPPAGPR